MRRQEFVDILNPVPIIFDSHQIINRDTPTVNDLLCYHLEIDADPLEWGTPDVLSSKDYPTAYQIALNILQDNTGRDIRYSFPNKSRFQHKRIMRKHYGKNERRRKHTVLTPTNFQPQCFRWNIQANNQSIGDAFLVPLEVNRNIFRARADNKPRKNFEVLLLAVESQLVTNNKKRRKPNKYKNGHMDVLIIEDNEHLLDFIPDYEDDDDTSFFALTADTPLSEPDLMQELSEQLGIVIESWWNEMY